MIETKKTQCNMCVLSCGLEMDVEDGKIVNVRPDKASPRSHGYCCRKGRNAQYYVHNPDRLDYPLKRVGDRFERISWEQAYREIGEKTRQLREKYGPRVFGMLGGALPSAQAGMVLGRSAMAGLGSQYFFNPIGIEFEGSWWSHGKIFGDQMHYLEPDDHNSEVLIFWGSNAYVSGMILNSRQVIREASRGTERMVIAVDPRFSETARMADLHIMPRPGSDAIMLRGMIALILKNGWQNREYIRKYVKDFEQIRPWFENVDIRECFRVAGVSYESMESFCRILTTKKWGMHQDLGVFMSRHNTLNCYLLLMLAVICGVAFMPGGCIVPECAMSRGDFTDENDPKVWRTLKTGRFPVLGTYPVGVVPDEIMSEHPERLRAMFCEYSNPARSFPDTQAMTKALGQLELFVVIDVCMTETAKLAHYVLPAKTGYEAYEFNAFQYNYPEIIANLKHPVIERQIGERKEDQQIWVELMKAMGVMPKLPDWLYRSAEKAAEREDRIPYFFNLLKYAAMHMKYFPMLPAIVAETLGKYMGSPTKAVYWAALMTSPIANTGMVKKANVACSGKHPILEKLPGFAEYCRIDTVFQQVLEHPEGTLMGISDPETMIQRHIRHKDKKIHLYCDEIDSYLRDITPEKEEAALGLNEGFPLVLSSGRHSDEGVNWIMRNPKMTEHRDAFKLQINPCDAKDLGLADGELAGVTTRAGSMKIEIEYSWNTSPGYVILPHHYGFTSQGKTYGFSANELVPHDHLDALTGNPIFRYVPCRVEKIEEETL